ncbi:MAG TPA: agmatinase family protein [Kiritimatiellia bacterium]|nr:agmatinase family protein [Kiritimatiellia bacterium]HMO98246.1 agmatinase family protein [Kiritimatiellia bacterium]HMP96591.1 agmatinase family protein [Kiritimatiellia bacterium]
MSLLEKISAFDPNAPAMHDANLFGLPFTPEEARCVVVPVPWEVTVSYGGGTAGGPAAILEASRQVDLYDPDYPEAWKLGVAMDALPVRLARESRRLRKKTETVLSVLSGKPARVSAREIARMRADIDAGCRAMIQEVRTTTQRWLDAGKLVALVGGDHSTPLGFLQALAERHPRFGVLQLDAHADLRNAYEGFAFSHASIMFNALRIPQIKRLVQVGIRDYCREEQEVIARSRGRVITHVDRDIRRALYRGRNMAALHRDIVKQLPREVYISFDIDGLDPKLCPHTGTPVPGGLEFEEALHLIYTVVESGRRIIGFDLNEVCPGDDEWDANVGARLLFRMINLMAASRGNSTE